MIACATHRFALDVPGADGVAKRDHLESVARQTGKRPAALHEPELPKLVEYLWQWFDELAYGRGNNGFGPARITWGDIAAWSALRNLRLESWELKALMLLDVAWFRATAAAKPPATLKKG